MAAFLRYLHLEILDDGPFHPHLIQLIEDGQAPLALEKENRQLPVSLSQAITSVEVNTAVTDTHYLRIDFAFSPETSAARRRKRLNFGGTWRTEDDKIFSFKAAAQIPQPRDFTLLIVPNAEIAGDFGYKVVQPELGAPYPPIETQAALQAAMNGTEDLYGTTWRYVKGRLNYAWDALFDSAPRTVASGIAPSTDVAQRPVYQRPDYLRSDTDFKIWYATNRSLIQDSDGMLQGYSATETNHTYYGTCIVHIPKGHKIGTTKSKGWRKFLLDVFRRPDRDALQLVSIKGMLSTAYWNDIHHMAQLVPADERSALVFIHGYNVTFRDAAIRAAQLAFDLKIPGPVSFFSWPSQGIPTGYLTDGEAIQTSVQAISQYLVDFAQNSGVDRVNILAHSMGNIGFAHAIADIVSKAEAASPVHFNQLILAAPDIDQKLFLQLAHNYPKIATRTTLYASKNDVALKASGSLRSRVRAGFAPPITIAPNIDTVHVGDIDLSTLGHGYVSENYRVIADIKALLSNNTAPENRLSLLAMEEGGQTYWEFNS